jgi:hypothetical protein
MKYLLTYYYKNDLEQRYKRYNSMRVAIAAANGDDWVVDSITTEYGAEE